MAIVLYDLVGADDRFFSPFCWRVRWALAHKDLAVERRPTRFTEISTIHGGAFKTVPVIEDGDRMVGGSFDIALYLEEAYPEAPSLFAGGIALARLIEHWTQVEVHARLVRLIVKDIHDHLAPADKEYFADSRRKRFGIPIEDVQADRDEHLPAFRAALEPLRRTVATEAFLGGEGPIFADYLVAGALQWARAVSPYRVLAGDDPVAAWFGRILDLYDGLGRRAPGYDIAA